MNQQPIITSDELAEQMKAEILDDVRNGVVPITIESFSELHDYVDANTYGGTEDLFGELVTESQTDEEHQEKLDKLSAIMNPAMDIVDAWIKAGGVHAIKCNCPKDVLFSKGCQCGGI